MYKLVQTKKYLLFKGYDNVVFICISVTEMD